MTASFLHLLCKGEHHNLNIIDFINDCGDEHQFIIFDRDNNTDPYLSYQSQVRVMTGNSQLLPWLRQRHADYDAVLVHGFFNHPLWELLAENRQLCQKTSWVVFGAELLLDRYPIDAQKLIAIEQLRAAVVPQLSKVILVTPEERQLCATRYGRTTGYAYYLYPPFGDDGIISPHYQKLLDGGGLSILTGNSSDPANRHELLLPLLAAHYPDAIIYCPLAYSGNDHYRTQVLTLGAHLFGPRFVAMTDVMPIRDYHALIAKIDCWACAHDRQQAAQHYLQFFKNGGAILATDDAPLANLFRRQGAMLTSLAAPPQSPQKWAQNGPSANNQTLYHQWYSRNRLIDQWRAILKSLIKSAPPVYDGQDDQAAE